MDSERQTVYISSISRQERKMYQLFQGMLLSSYDFSMKLRLKCRKLQQQTGKEYLNRFQQLNISQLFEQYPVGTVQIASLIDTLDNIFATKMQLLRYSNVMRFSSQPLLRKTLPFRNGGVHCIPRAVIQAYVNRRLSEGQTYCRQHALVRSVQAFKKEIEDNPVLKMCIVGGLHAIPEGGILAGQTYDQVLQAVSTICVSPPKFENIDLAGVPFFSLFTDFLNTRFGQAFFIHPRTNHHLRNIFNEYQDMLLSKVSLQYMNTNPDGWLCPAADRKANYSDYIIDKSYPHWGFKSWNDWFTRPLKPGARPIDCNPKAIVHSSDSYPLFYPPGKVGTNPTNNVKGENYFWLKDNRYSLHDMLGSSKMGITDLVNQHFVGGTVYQAFLDPWCYHRWHAPISGTIIKSYRLEGTYYLDNPGLPLDGQNGQQHNYVDSQPMLSVVSVRQVFIIQLDGSDKLIAVIEIGMAEVSGCHPTVIEGQHVNKGDELGYFAFGGSSYAMIFDKDFDLTFKKDVFAINCKSDGGELQTCKQYVNSLLCTFA